MQIDLAAPRSASSEPIIATSPPAAIAFARSPEYLIPPSAMTGTPSPWHIFAASMIAVNCGTPTPATIRVVQIDPGPIPTLTASAPASINAFAPSAVATLPPITCTALAILRTAETVFRTPSEWPWHIDMMTSTLASINASAQARPSLPAPVAAATSNVPRHPLRPSDDFLPFPYP